jgi:hypothetical protein
MKIRYKSILCIVVALIMTAVYTSCSDDDQSGTPIIRYIRITDPASSDSLLVAGSRGNMVAIIGNNLDNVKQIWFNDLRASLNPSYITNTSILTTIPSEVPKKLTNQMKLVVGPGDTIFHDFQIVIDAPVVNTMSSEYAKPGETVEFHGDNFFEPLTVTFEGGAEAEVVKVEQQVLSVKIPEGAQPGPISFKTNFGTTVSKLQYMDRRNIILNYDDLTAAGSWRPGVTASTDGLEGNYLLLKGFYGPNERTEDPFTSQFWGNKRYPTPRQLFEGDYTKQALKFEAYVEQWYGSVLMICWGPYDLNGNGEVWGELNGKGLWKPWEAENKLYSTKGKWITVTVPLVDMKYKWGQKDGNVVFTDDKPFNPLVAGSLSFWVVSTAKADNSPVDLKIDNVRIVEY